MIDEPVILGEKYRDGITGFEGTATARYEYLHGCVRYVLERGDKDGKLEEFVFDEQRLEFPKGRKKPKATATTGGPRGSSRPTGG